MKNHKKVLNTHRISRHNTFMGNETRTWMVKSNTGEQSGPYEEDVFQKKLRAGNIPFYYTIKSNEMSDWQPLVQVISDDASFHRASTMPPPPPEED